MNLEFPELPAPTYPIPIETEDPALRSPFENGSVQTRAKFTRQRRTWTLNWPALSTVDREILNDFFIETVGGAVAFVWLDQDENEITVRFLSFKETQHTPNLWEVSATIQET